MSGVDMHLVDMEVYCVHLRCIKYCSVG
jgi:hypothetical protein